MNTFCRDGVSEGQFYQVLLYELDAIRKVIPEFFPVLLFIYLHTKWCLLGGKMNQISFLVLLAYLKSGMCVFGAKLSAAGHICRGSETSSH